MTTESQDHERDAIRSVIADVDRTQSDPDGFARLLTEEVVLVNFGGRQVRGRANVHAAMTEALKTPFAAVLTRNDVEHVEFLREDVAVVSATKHIDDGRGTVDDPLPDRGRATYVLVKDIGDWHVAAIQTTPIRIA